MVLSCLLTVLLFLGTVKAWAPCWGNTTLSQLDPPGCASCWRRCGRVVDLQNQASCSCDDQCFMYGDCCYDMPSQCPAEYAASRNISVTKETTCEKVTVNDDPEWKFMYMMVSDCPADPDACRWSVNSVYDFLPVVDNVTGLHYINVKCAVCNGAESLVPWRSNVTCRSLKVNYHGKKTDFKTLETRVLIEKSVRLPMKDAECRLDLSPPVHTKAARRCLPAEKLDQHCSSPCDNHDLAHACKHLALNYFHIGKTVYRNHYCALCTPSWRKLRCGAGEGLVRGSNDPWVSRFEMNLIFDFDPSDGLKVGQTVMDSPSCPQFTEWKDFKCRKVGFVSTSSDVGTDADQSSICTTDADNDVMEYLADRLFNITGLHLGISIKRIDSNVQLQVFINNSIYTLPHKQLENKTKEYANRVIQSLCPPDKRFKISVLDIKLRHISKKCIFIEYDVTEVVFKANHTLYNKINKQDIDGTEWYGDKDNKSVYICQHQDDPSSSKSRVLGILTFVLLVVSVVALVIRIAAHFIFTEFQNNAGRVQTSLAAAILLAYVAFLLGPSQARGSIGCHVIAVVRHWTLLAMFLWMSVVSVDIWRMVWMSSKLFKMEQSKATFLFFSLFAWVTPTLFVVIGEILNFIIEDERFQPQYGAPVCWFNQRYALLVLFVIPVALCLLVNSTAFVTCLVLLVRSRGNTVSTNKEARNDYNIILYFKLFILMGLTWILGLVVELFNHISIDYLYTIFNASLGLILTVGTLCFGHVGRAVCRKILKAAPVRYSRSMSTDSTRSGETKQSTM